MSATPVAPLLQASGIEHHYEGVRALAGVSIAAGTGEFLAVLGPNGAGKSTLALIMSGVLRPTLGTLSVDGTDLTALSGRRGLVEAGVALIPEGRRLFGQLSVQENLLLGAYGAGAGAAETRRRMERVYTLMPERVRDGRERSVVTLSGGEQQMVAIGRALMAKPRAMLIDEPSLGLAPILIDAVYWLLAGLRREGVAIVVFEQLAVKALQHADRIVAIDRGEVFYEGAAKTAATRSALRAGYLGIGTEG